MAMVTARRSSPASALLLRLVAGVVLLGLAGATTLAGVCLRDGSVVVGADTRATGAATVADKRCLKLHALAPGIVVAGAGTSAACDEVTRTTEMELSLEALRR
eukprot:CAMPEP_0118857176 /NCGR_PEP_ID=MMETSP1163-20130328/4385_1 /TAXON_ID=124430 /ORGANISM="Phaeomonas parva, Strain CCMP2877" /LENGTH=102 /DNA_ID=CAMNT_0006790441 /DNA_START=240 /DNA_END=545 /DNA_ORIENTATION=-